MTLHLKKQPERGLSRQRKKPLGALELIAIALGGMVGGGIFSILGISVAQIGAFTPFAILLGGGIAFLAAYSYVKLALYYKDEGATYSFFKLSYPKSHFAASLIGWWVTFGYISTLALYAYTFASYALSDSAFADSDWVRKGVAGLVIIVFALINIWSVRGMGKLEDIIVYTKLVILFAISFVLINHSETTIPALLQETGDVSLLAILVVASITFVAYEGFQLVIHAMNEMENPDRNIPRAIYSAVGIATAIYFVIAIGAILAIPFADIIAREEYALASGAGAALGPWGMNLVIFGALLATSSAISGTLFGASRLMAVIAGDGYFPKLLAKRRGHIPTRAIIMMSGFAIVLIFAGGLKVILEFASVTFLLVSALMAMANFKMRGKTGASAILTLGGIGALSLGTILILYYEWTTEPKQLAFILGLYALLITGAWLHTRLSHLRG